MEIIFDFIKNSVHNTILVIQLYNGNVYCYEHLQNVWISTSS